MKPGPKKRVFKRISVSLGKGQKEGLQTLAKGREVSVADLVMRPQMSMILPRVRNQDGGTM